MKVLLTLFAVFMTSLTVHSTQLPAQLKFNASVHLKNNEPYTMQIVLIKKSETSKKVKYKGHATVPNLAQPIEVRMEVRVSNMYRIEMWLEELALETEKYSLAHLLGSPLSAKAEVWETVFDDFCHIGDDLRSGSCVSRYRVSHGTATLQVTP